jgi:hypothetical protein
MLLHGKTELQMKSLVKSPSHGVIVSGVEGSGKFYLAKNLVKSVLKLNSLNDLETHPYVSIVMADDDTLKIDQIRQLSNFLQLKTIGEGQIRRAAIIKDAHQMNIQSQNAILKILEEPPEDTIIIMTVSGESILKPTIYSRAQHINVLPVSLDSAINYFAGSHDKDEVKGAYLYSGGATGLLYELLNDEGSDYLAWRDRAKSLLSSPQQKRLAEINELSKDRVGVKKLVFALKKLSLVALHNSSLSDKDDVDIKSWLNRLDTLLVVEKNLDHSNLRLSLTYLFINI